MKNFIYILIFLGFLFSCTKGPGGIYEPTTTEPNLDSLGITIDSLGNYIDSTGNIVVIDSLGNVVIIDSVVVLTGVGYFIDGKNIFKTTDSGMSWSTQYSVSNLNDEIDGISFVNETTGYFIDGISVFKTTNSGLSWSLQYSHLNSNDEIEYISFVN